MLTWKFRVVWPIEVSGCCRPMTQSLYSGAVRYSERSESEIHWHSFGPWLQHGLKPANNQRDSELSQVGPGPSVSAFQRRQQPDGVTLADSCSASARDCRCGYTRSEYEIVTMTLGVLRPSRYTHWFRGCQSRWRGSTRALAASHGGAVLHGSTLKYCQRDGDVETVTERAESEIHRRSFGPWPPHGLKPAAEL